MSTENNLLYLFDKLSQVQRILMWEVAKKEKMTPTQMNLITFICEYPQEICTMSNIAKEFDLTQATVSEALSSLEKKELLERKQGKDKRKHFLVPTVSGKKKYKLLSSWKEEFIKQLEVLETDNKTELLKTLTNVIDGFSKSSVISVARICIACNNYSEENGKKLCSITGNDKDISYGCDKFVQTEK